MSDIDKKGMRGRSIHLGIYLVLILGSITMIYPMLIMLSASMASNADYEQYHLFPRYLVDDHQLWRKYLEIRYDREFQEFKHRYRLEGGVGDFRYYFGRMRVDVHDAAIRQRVRDWNDFKKTDYPQEANDVFFSNRYRSGLVQQKYHRWLRAKYHTIRRFNDSFTSYVSKQPFHSFQDVEYVPENLMGHNWPPLQQDTKKDWQAFKALLDGDFLRALVFTHDYQQYLIDSFATIERFNQAMDASYASFYDIEFTSSPPVHPKRKAVWQGYTTSRYPLRYVKVPGDHLAGWKSFILAQEEFGRSPDGFNRLYMADRDDAGQTDYFSRLVWTETIPRDPFLAPIWSRYVDHLPVEQKRFLSTFERYRLFLKRRYRTIDALNQAHGLHAKTFRFIRPPFQEADAVFFVQNKSMLKKHFLLDNYRQVLHYIVLNGRALQNTLILIVLWVGGHLTVQPMAAYALSRFRLSHANKILLFLLATMSFPHSVTMIPNFLLLKDLHLLNTYWALVLPHLVQGMGIFLLKGYFDSLPDELYEAGMIDGASEIRMFWHITLPLSTPILAVIGLHSFTAAYGSFMWAFLICQKEEMWTLMVFLHQFQQYAPPYTHMSALVIAAIPTFLVFMFAQKVIMRGIVVPTMK